MLNRKLLAVALLSTMGLVACGGEVQAKPTNYNEPVITFSDSKDEIYHNLISIIDDAYRDGSLASAVLDKVLYQYSVSVFGRYNKVAAPYNLGSEEITLKQAVESIQANNLETARKFIDNHKAYWSTDKDGNRLTDEVSKSRELARVQSKWDAIEMRISRKFHEAIAGGSYSTRSYLSEKKYLVELRSQLKKVLNPYDSATVMYEESDKKVITPDVQEEEVFDATKGYLHRDNYQDAASYTIGSEDKLDGAKATYVEDEIIPQIYRTLLVEQYLLDESYNSLGRSYARKVNVISISPNANNDKAADYLMKYFVRDVISGGKLTKPEAELEDDPYWINLKDFKEVSNAMKGVTAEAQSYLDAVNDEYPGAFTKTSFQGYPSYDASSEYTYYVGTDYGDMMKNFEKIKQNINQTDASVESDFTGTYTYDATVGLEIKSNEIAAKDYVTDGWYIKNGGLSDLPDAIKSRLFNIGVSNVLNNDSVVDRYETDTYTVPASESKLVAKINRKYYLKVASKQSGADEKDDILFYEGGKYYVVQIEEAVSGSKLAKESEKYDIQTKEDIINEVARVVANNDTYQTSSTKHWLEQAEIKYHDTKIYDYFKENYPDLFK